VLEAGYCYRCRTTWPVCLSACVGTTVSRAKTAEPIDMPIGEVGEGRLAYAQATRSIRACYVSVALTMLFYFRFYRKRSADDATAAGDDVTDDVYDDDD